MEVYRKHQQERWLKDHPEVKEIKDNPKFYQKGYDHPIFEHQHLLNRSKERVSVEEALKDKYIGIYFAARWNKECQQFTPLLISAYNEYNRTCSNTSKKLEIVFVSSDESEKDMMQFMEDFQMPWFCIPFNDHLRKDKLMGNYHVNSFPKLAVIDPRGNDLTSYFGDNIVDLITRDGYVGFTKVISGHE